MIFTHIAPPDLKTATGTISSFNHHERNDPNPIDYWANDASSYLDVKLSDGSSFRAIGIRYNNLDNKLFSKLAVGTEITITYEDAGWGGGLDNIYGIEYYGTAYLNTENVLADFKAETKSTVIGCSIAIAVITVVAGGAFIANYFKFKYKPKEKISK